MINTVYPGTLPTTHKTSKKRVMGYQRLPLKRLFMIWLTSMSNAPEFGTLPGALNASQARHQQRDIAVPFGRAMLMGRSCLVFECLREAMYARGIETDAEPFERGIAACGSGYDVFVIFLMRGEPGLQMLVKQRLAELRVRMPQVPTVALVEDPGAEAAAFCEMGFSTVVLGLPSVPFAVDVVHLLLLGGHHARDFDRCERDAPALRVHIEGDDREPLLGLPEVCFTRREIELLELLRRGMQNKLIAYQLGISQSTVKAHLRSIMMKLKAKNRTQAIGMLTQDADSMKVVQGRASARA
jgi:DNA-binding NarL/FixJ family response regulator